MAIIRDSGQRQSFSSGSVRDIREGKGRYDLLPTRALKKLAQHFEAGSKKYGDRNWEKGQPLSRYLDSGIRHAFEALTRNFDEPHAEAAAWNLMCFIETRERIRLGLLPQELDDLGFVEAEPPTTLKIGPQPSDSCGSLIQIVKADMNNSGGLEN